MEWEFTPEDVVQGNAAYGLEEFRRDLLEEVRMNMAAEAEPAEFNRMYALVYDMCYWLATGRELEEFEQELDADPILLATVRMIHRHCKPNVEMLGAILQRSIMDNVDAGMPLEQALEDAAASHTAIVNGTAKPATGHCTHH